MAGGAKIPNIAAPTAIARLAAPLGRTARGFPKDRFPKGARDPRDALSAVRDEPLRDGNARQNLATFYRTWEAPEVRKVNGGT